MRDHWHPEEGKHLYRLDDITPGTILALDAPGYRHKPWRVHEVRGWRDDRLHVVLRPDGPAFDFAQHNQTISIRRHPTGISVLPEHYGLCHHCGELTPCSEVWSAAVAAEHAARDARYEVEGICPACQEPVTDRQQSHRFPENLRVPLGPPVIFHARRRCLSTAIQYDREVAAATDREPRLSCGGTVTQHLDGYKHCTSATCPGADVQHRVWMLCSTTRPGNVCDRHECWVSTWASITEGAPDG